MKYRKIAFIFPGQGAQYVGMGKDFAETFPLARQTFEEADDLLQKRLSSLIFEGPLDVLTETHNSQVGIYVVSMAMLRVIEHLFPDLQPAVCAGHSLGEYSALTATKKASFIDTLPIVQLRGLYMKEACDATRGGMAALIGLDGETIEKMIDELALPYDLWAANYNCPGQVVISGTHKGIEAGIAAAKTKGAKRALPLQVHGAFHSGLMKEAEKKLAPHLLHMPLRQSDTPLVMNVTASYVSEVDVIRHNLIKQVTHPVRWEYGIRAMMAQGIDLFIEIGCGKVLSGLNKRIGVESYSIEHIADLARFEKEVIPALQ